MAQQLWCGQEGVPVATTPSEIIDSDASEQTPNIIKENVITSDREDDAPNDEVSSIVVKDDIPHHDDGVEEDENRRDDTKHSSIVGNEDVAEDKEEGKGCLLYTSPSPRD